MNVKHTHTHYNKVMLAIILLIRRKYLQFNTQFSAVQMFAPFCGLFGCCYDKRQLHISCGGIDRYIAMLVTVCGHVSATPPDQYDVLILTICSTISVPVLIVFRVSSRLGHQIMVLTRRAFSQLFSRSIVPDARSKAESVINISTRALYYFAVRAGVQRARLLRKQRR